ncbi:hypothetical protein DQ04_07021000 [Trypanosoma grayi]|uniref:hypothetical protein n=1 Tax=Trypanosoma grayi TaxID=71804 RepID=UPI0004F47FE3|nr:hypothetical protein DQ04_07021000 [Trypanosoma grayi]KEG08505.1 hypothetical protein DQ04_07021000 [Trypanosoma grayi]
MNPIFVDYLVVLLWNITAAKCALGSAVIVAPVWAFIVKPLLQHFSSSSSSRFSLGVFATMMERCRAQSNSAAAPQQRRQGKAGASKKASSAEHAQHAEANEGVASGASVVKWAAPAASVTNDALVALFRSPEFALWYGEHRDSLLQRVRVRCAQRIWASLATLTVLLLGMFVLPLFTLANEGATLWVLLQRRSSERAVIHSTGWYGVLATACGRAETLLLLVAGLTLLTAVFMPANAKHTASVELVAFLILVAEAAQVERLAFGAGFAVLLGVVVWRIASVCD